MKNFFNFEMTEGKVYTLIVYLYVFIGILYCFIDKYIPPKFIVLIIFFTFKMLSNYKKCTLSYLECKMRKVKRKDGYLASLMDHIVDLRTTRHKYILYPIAFILIINAPFRDMIKFKKFNYQ